MLLATHTGSTHRFSEKQHSSEKALPQKYAASSKEADKSEPSTMELPYMSTSTYGKTARREQQLQA